MKYVGSRDMQASSAVAVMAQLGRFETEFLIYGTAVQENDHKIYYYATTNQEKLYQCIEKARFEERYFMPMIRYIKRLKVPADLEEVWLAKTKIELIQQMKHQYEFFLPRMEPLFRREPTDQALGLLEQYQEAIDGYFDDTLLQLFEGLVNMSYEGKILSRQSFLNLKKWHDKIRHQMHDDPVCVDSITREFYGFVFVDKHGKRNTVFDAQKMNVVEMQQEKMIRGYLTGPIMKKQYAFKQFGDMPKIHQQYSDWLLSAQSESYFQMIAQLKKMPGVVLVEELDDIAAAVTETEYAAYSTAYYTAVLNKKN